MSTLAMLLLQAKLPVLLMEALCADNLRDYRTVRFDKLISPEA